jgi:hypothetical protein
MSKALALKELRETAWIVAVAAAAYLYGAGGAFGYGIMTGPSYGYRYWTRPFTEILQANLSTFVMVSLGLAAGLGIRQAVAESSRGMWQFLLHRPASRRWIVGGKLLVGMTLYLTVAAVPILVLSLWRSIPGTHPSPFEWSMMSNHWLVWYVLTPLYLGGFLTGLRPGRWVGTRLLPLAGIGIVVLGAAGAAIELVGSWLVALVAIAVLDFLLIITVFYVAETRDFS